MMRLRNNTYNTFNIRGLTKQPTLSTVQRNNLIDS